MSGIELISHIVPKNNNNFYLVEDGYIKGGFRSVSTYSEISSIPIDSRKVGSIVYVQDEDRFYKFYPTTSTVVLFTTNLVTISTANSPYSMDLKINVLSVLADTNNVTVNLPELELTDVGKSIKIKMSVSSNASYTTSIVPYGTAKIDTLSSISLSPTTGLNSVELYAETQLSWIITSSHKL